MNKKLVFMGASVLLIVAPLFALAETFNRQLELGMSGSDISTMQSFFAEDPSLYPQGLVTGYFGFLTKSAVSNFQDRHGIEAVGRVGPQTLPVLNAQYANRSGLGGDVYAPVMWNVQTVTASDRAVITWNTSELVRGKVYYSTSPIRISNIFDVTGVNSGEPVVSGVLAPYDGVARTSHSVTITGLSPNTVYYYLAVSVDGMANTSISLPAYFRTN
jgi:hypothetical protein